MQMFNLADVNWYANVTKIIPEQSFDKLTLLCVIYIGNAISLTN